VLAVAVGLIVTQLRPLERLLVINGQPYVVLVIFWPVFRLIHSSRRYFGSFGAISPAECVYSLNSGVRKIGLQSGSKWPNNKNLKTLYQFVSIALIDTASNVFVLSSAYVFNYYLTNYVQSLIEKP